MFVSYVELLPKTLVAGQRHTPKLLQRTRKDAGKNLQKNGGRLPKQFELSGDILLAPLVALRNKANLQKITSRGCLIVGAFSYFVCIFRCRNFDDLLPSQQMAKGGPREPRASQNGAKFKQQIIIWEGFSYFCKTERGTFKHFVLILEPRRPESTKSFTLMRGKKQQQIQCCLTKK